MGEFASVAESILGALSESEGGIRASEIPDLVGSRGQGGEVNCYPGRPGSGCHSVAFFVSLNSKSNAKGSDHLPFVRAIERFVQHMQGQCRQNTHTAVIITDSWEVRILETWKSNIIAVQETANVEIYLLTKNVILEMTV